MLEASRDFVFQDVYDYVALVEACAQDAIGFIELGLEENLDLGLRLYRPHKLSLLHEYIYAMIRVEQSREYRKNSDIYEEHDAEKLERNFEEYGVPYIPFSSMDLHSEEFKSEAEFPFYRWFLVNECAFLHYWEMVADEVFHIVFSNRRFLQQFGVSLADYISSNRGCLPSGILSADGRIKRYGRIPSWLRKAVFYRDHGRCVVCRKDLSGLTATDRRLTLDHIVPLALWGSNDPSNFQLLCEGCNLKKADSPERAGRFYVPWWDY